MFSRLLSNSIPNNENLLTHFKPNSGQRISSASVSYFFPNQTALVLDAEILSPETWKKLLRILMML